MVSASRNISWIVTWPTMGKSHYFNTELLHLKKKTIMKENFSLNLYLAKNIFSKEKKTGSFERDLKY